MHQQFTYLGPRWAQAATAPSRMYKSKSHITLALISSILTVKLQQQLGTLKEVSDALPLSDTLVYPK